MIEKDTPALSDIAMPMETIIYDPRMSLLDMASSIITHNQAIPPQHIIIPGALESMEVKKELEQILGSHIHVYSPGEILNIELDRPWEKLMITEEVSHSSGTECTYGDLDTKLYYSSHPTYALNHSRLITALHAPVLWER